MANEKVYAQGLFAKNKTAPFGDYVAMSFKVDEFITWLQENQNENGWANVDLLSKRDNSGYYGVLDDFQPAGKKDKSGGLPF
jgi:hypothetical protein